MHCDNKWPWFAATCQESTFLLTVCHRRWSSTLAPTCEATGSSFVAPRKMSEVEMLTVTRNASGYYFRILLFRITHRFHCFFLIWYSALTLSLRFGTKGSMVQWILNFKVNQNRSYGMALTVWVKLDNMIALIIYPADSFPNLVTNRIWNNTKSSFAESPNRFMEEPMMINGHAKAAMVYFKVNIHLNQDFW